jgi:hypothetical protein
LADIEVSGDRLIVHVTGVEGALALKRQLEVPLDHVVGVQRGLGEDGHGRWMKRLGTHISGVVKAGTFHAHGKRLFWDVRDRDQAIAIKLRDEKYEELVIQVEDPESAVDAIQEATTR